MDIFSNPNWFQLPGKAKRVSTSNGRLYGVNKNNYVYHGESYRNPNWKPVNGVLKQVDLDVIMARAVNPDNYIFCANLGTDFANPKWFNVPGNVSVNIGRLYGITLKNEID